VTHRILLVGRDSRTLDGLTAALRRVDQAVMPAEIGQQAANLARQFRPSVVVLVAPNETPAALEDLAVLGTHPATASVPLVSVTRTLRTDEAIEAFQRGVAGLVYGAEAKALVERLDAVLGSSLDAARRATATDRRGPAVLRRIAAFLKGAHASGHLHINAGGEEALLPVRDGSLGAVQYGDLRGKGALAALVSHPDATHWTFTFDDPTAEKKPEPEPADDDSLDIDIDDAELSLEGMPPSEDVTATGSLLLVDDDPALVGLYRRFLERAGFAVETAANGREGLERALAVRPDVILSDIMMPEVDGWGFLTEVRGDFRLRDTRFLLLSCHTDYVHKLRELDAGADDYLEKGLRGEEIVARVSSSVENRPRSAPPGCSARSRGRARPAG
jgi:DNA-binding response OmpR family regulator